MHLSLFISLLIKDLKSPRRPPARPLAGRLHARPPRAPLPPTAPGPHPARCTPTPLRSLCLPVGGGPAGVRLPGASHGAQPGAGGAAAGHRLRLLWRQPAGEAPLQYGARPPSTACHMAARLHPPRRSPRRAAPHAAPVPRRSTEHSSWSQGPAPRRSTSRRRVQLLFCSRGNGIRVVRGGAGVGRRGRVRPRERGLGADMWRHPVSTHLCSLSTAGPHLLPDRLSVFRRPHHAAGPGEGRVCEGG